MHTISTSPNWDDSPAMQCPACGDEYTHHLSTSIFNREFTEDGPTRLITVDGFGDITNRPSNDSPSPRRDAVVLHFECESGCRFDLQFIQHKGNTFVVHHIHPKDEENDADPISGPGQ